MTAITFSYVKHSLILRAFIVGIVFFIISLIGLHMLFSWENWQYSHHQIIESGATPIINPTDTSDVFLIVILTIVIGYFIMLVLIGVATALVLPYRRAIKSDVSNFSFIAGIIPLTLLSLMFWILYIDSLIKTINDGGWNIVSSQIWFYLFGICINIIIILLGAYISRISGLSTSSIIHNIRMRSIIK